MSREPLTFIPALDGLRALACVLVVASHIPKYMSEATTLFHTDIPLGELGVTIFFVLSGFLMSHLYLSKEPTRHQLVLYVIARFSRIAPAYWLAILSSYVVYQYVDASFLFDVSNSNVLRHLLFIGSAGIFWSIPPGIHYCAYFMLIWFVWQKRRNVVWLISLSLFSFETKLSEGVFGNKVMRWVGKVSFSVYLFHGFILYYSNVLANRFELSGHFVDVSVFVISILLPGLFSIWIELPLCRWTKQQLQRRYQRFTEQRKQKVVLLGS